jgi:hypothetical protein
MGACLFFFATCRATRYAFRYRRDSIWFASFAKDTALWALVGTALLAAAIWML